jgi:hypothetical protein
VAHAELAQLHTCLVDASVAMVAVTFVMTFIFLYIPFLVYNVPVLIAALIFGGTAKLAGPSLGENILDFGGAPCGHGWIAYSDFYSAGDAA